VEFEPVLASAAWVTGVALSGVWRWFASSPSCANTESNDNHWPTQSDPGEVPSYEQRSGDPVAGYTALVNAGIVRCGIPLSAYSQVFGPAPANARVDGRTKTNATLPYHFTATTTSSGVEIVSANCLTCHAEYMNGELVIGLGNTTSDFTTDDSNLAVLARALVDDDTEREELEKFIDRLVTAAPYTLMSTRGVNPADNLAAILFTHRDQHTLAWSYQPLLDPPPMLGVPVDVPPWWRMRNKNAMFYVGAGRGDQARHMMAASSLCTDTVEEARPRRWYYGATWPYRDNKSSTTCCSRPWRIGGCRAPKSAPSPRYSPITGWIETSAHSFATACSPWRASPCATAKPSKC